MWKYTGFHRKFSFEICGCCVQLTIQRSRHLKVLKLQGYLPGATGSTKGKNPVKEINRSVFYVSLD
jgi:hypothetical protein